MIIVSRFACCKAWKASASFCVQHNSLISMQTTWFLRRWQYFPSIRYSIALYVVHNYLDSTDQTKLSIFLCNYPEVDTFSTVLGRANHNELFLSVTISSSGLLNILDWYIWVGVTHKIHLYSIACKWMFHYQGKYKLYHRVCMAWQLIDWKKPNHLSSKLILV